MILVVGYPLDEENGEERSGQESEWPRVLSPLQALGLYLLEEIYVFIYSLGKAWNYKWVLKFYKHNPR